MDKFGIKNSAVFIGIGLGIGGLTPLLSIYIPRTVESIFNNWPFYSQVLIILLGLLCFSPMVYQLMKYGTKKIEFFSPTIIFPLLYFAVFGLGSLGLLSKDDRRVITILLCAVAGIIFFYLGVTFMNLAMNTKRKTNLQAPSINWDPYLLQGMFFIFFMLSLFATTYHAFKTGLPIFTPNLEEVRIKIQQEVSNYVIFLMRLITPAFFFIFTYGIMYRKVKNITLIFFFLIGVLVLLSLANRHDIFTFLMTSIIIFNFTAKKFNFSKLIGILFIGLLFLMSIGFYRLITLSYITPEGAFLMKVAGPNMILMFLAYFAFQFTNYPLNFAIYLDAFPEILSHEWGYSFIRGLSTILPGHQQLLDEYVKSELRLEFLGGGINPTLLGELYANFGYMGLLGMIIYGAIITFLFHKMLKSRNSIYIVSYSFGVSSLLLSTIGGFFSHFLYFYYIFVIAFMHFIIKRKSIKKDFYYEHPPY